MKQVIVEVAPDGQVTIKAVGFKGASCEKATAAIERAMGTVTGKTRTPEYYQKEQQGQIQGQG